MNFFDKMLFYVAVPRCVSCNERLEYGDRAVCRSCLREYSDAILRNCPSCAKILSECDCTNKYLDSHYIHRLVKLYRYSPKGRGVTNSLIFSLKRDNRRDVLSFLSDELSLGIKNSVDSPEDLVFTSVPRRKRAIVKYGIDHAELLGRSVAKKLGAKYEKILISKVKKEQKKSNDADARVKNAVYELKNKSLDLSGRNVIIIDDIVTTGASMGNCAMLIKSTGAKKIIGATLAIAYKE